MKDICCDRAFAPAPDFERLLRERKIPLYGLDTGLSLACFDLLMFTLGYELGLSGVLLMLDVSQIPLRCGERGEEYPVVIAGGPAVSNPLPYSPFIDAFWIGEAEAGFFDLATELGQLKKNGQGRATLLEKISYHPNVWVKGKEKASRAIYTGFSLDNTEAAVFPIPSMKIVHNHGTVEIMRGCPNGCRFCHAGFWYRPMRQKSREQIVSHVREIVTKGGWQQVCLSSLSSGDYCGVGELVDDLNREFSSLHVSFQMPSLRVSSFSLDLLEKISVTRKSGLTFAVETPQEAWQMAVNKEVTRNSVATILEEAKKRGWKSAKFYFMIGLPLPPAQKNEEEEIVDFIADVGRRTRMRFNINVGIFNPKPHTPYQRTPQIDSAEAEKKLEYIKVKAGRAGHRVSIADPLVSQIEGLLSRGDERVGFLCEQAYLGGSRLDAWDEYINKDKWLRLVEANRGLVNDLLSGKKKLPWDVIDSRVSKGYLKNELEKSENCLRTASCTEKCGLCGVCEKNLKIIKNRYIYVNHNYNKINNKSCDHKSDPAIYRVLFSFSKSKGSVFYGHLSLIEIFSMSFRRANIPVIYTRGFNPLAKIEFASPLATGISGECEFAATDFSEKVSIDFFINSLNKCLPQGIRIENGEVFYIPGGTKKYSLSSLLWGFSYANTENKVDYVNATQEKVYRRKRLERENINLFSLKRSEVLARNMTGGNSTKWESYFKVYRFLYPESVI
jgi:radical SAM-linked protein